ncbi:MAG: TRAP transporter small permease subunit [Acetobacteraceae bacterium]|nr:TRAP transporter small permease subunit [Acetobacteraceae bacterium]
MLVAFLAGAWQVFTRFVLQEPSPWSEALVRQALIWMVLLGLAGAIREGALVAIDIARASARGWLKRVIELVILAAILALFGVLFWFGWAMAERVRFQSIAGLEVSIAWGYAAIPVGAVFAIVAAVAALIDPRPDEAAGAA